MDFWGGGRGEIKKKKIKGSQTQTKKPTRQTYVEFWSP